MKEGGRFGGRKGLTGCCREAATRENNEGQEGNKGAGHACMKMSYRNPLFWTMNMC